MKLKRPHFEKLKSLTKKQKKLMNQVERVAGEVSTADMAGRMDLRDWQTVTIDGEDAKELDDAITLTKEGDVYRLGVHIADVTQGQPPGVRSRRITSRKSS